MISSDQLKEALAENTNELEIYLKEELERIKEELNTNYQTDKRNYTTQGGSK